MISKKVGDWWVTTPLYVGEKADILRMSLCEHAEYAASHPVASHRIPETGEPVEMGMEKCVACGAARSRYRYPDPERNKRP